MSKNNDLTHPEAVPQQPAGHQTEPKANPPVSTGMIWTFWGAVAAALVSARALDAMLPQIPERIIERWVMLAFAAFLAVFLVKLK